MVCRSSRQDGLDTRNQRHSIDNSSGYVAMYSLYATIIENHGFKVPGLTMITPDNTTTITNYGESTMSSLTNN